MDCKRFRELISFWIDGMLDKQEQEYFIQHMENCEQCGNELNEYKNMISLMQSMEEVRLPEGFHDRLYVKLEKEIKQSKKLLINSNNSIKLIRWFGGIAAIFILLFSIRIFDDVGFIKDDQFKNHIEMESIENPNGASGLSIASIFNDEKDRSASRKEEVKKELQIQEKAESYDIADDVQENSIVESDDISNNSILDNNTSNKDKKDISTNNIEDKNITENNDTSKRKIVASSASDDAISDGDIQDNILTDIETDENNTSVEPEFNDYGVMQFSVQNTSGIIETNLVKVKVQDVCITPFTLKMMALNNGIEVIKSTEDSVILKLTGLEEREILYRELSRIGEIEDSGEKTDSMQVTVIIIR